MCKWASLFGGSAWNYYPHQDIWALHLFSKKQMDLNWASLALKAEMHKMMRWWLGKGVDGFRLDIIFSFDHLENPGKTRFDDYLYDLRHLKNYSGLIAKLLYLLIIPRLCVPKL